MITRLAKVDGETVLIGANDGCIVSKKRQRNLNNLAKMRKNKPTPAEKKLIFHLRRLCKMTDDSLRYSRERVIHYADTLARIVDLAFHHQKIIIEVDGGCHNGTIPEAMDEFKDRLADDCGWETLRFKNEEVLGDISGVVFRIVEALLNKRRSLSRTTCSHLLTVQRRIKSGEWETMVGETFERDRQVREGVQA